MTATILPALVAEALAVGLQYTTHDGLAYDDSGKLRPPRHLLVEPDGVRVVDTSSDRDDVLTMAVEHADCSVYYRDDVVDAALVHLAERCEKMTDALVLARVETAKAIGRTERAIVAGESLLVQLTEAKERAARAERDASAYEVLVRQVLLGKGLASIRTEDAPKLLARLIDRGVAAEWDDAGEEAPHG